MHGSDLLNYRDKDFVVILSAGRSGSTLLQGVLNTIPGYLIRGENYALLLNICRTYRALELMAGQTSSSATPESPWFGAGEVDPEAFLRDSTRAVIRQILGNRSSESFDAIGFKEIRWTAPDLGGTNLWTYLKFIEEMFPRAKFVLLTRNIADIIKSGWWQVADQAAAMADIESFYILARAAPVSNFFELQYEQLAPDSDGLHALFRFLGKPYIEQVNATLQRPHSFKSRIGAGTQDLQHELSRRAAYIAELESFRTTQSRAIDWLRGQLDGAAAELASRAGLIAELEAYRDALLRQLTTGADELTRSSAYIAELEGHRDSLRGELQIRDDELSRSGAYIAEIESYRDTLQAALQSRADELARSHTYIAELERHRDSLRDELQARDDELSRSGAYIRELETYRELLRDQLQAAVGERAARAKENARLEGEPRQIAKGTGMDSPETQ